MTALSLIIATLGAILALGAWWGCHWLAQRMDRDDRKEVGE